MQRHHKSGAPEYAEIEQSTSVDSLIIIDRAVDWVTPMCTQLTYEGMLDEFVGIKNGERRSALLSYLEHPAEPQVTSRLTLLCSILRRLPRTHPCPACKPKRRSISCPAKTAYSQTSVI